MEPRISFVTLGVSDLARSVMFYRDGLGFPLSSASKDEVGFFKTGGVVLALCPTAHFKGKTIRVRGVVIRKEKGPYIEIHEPSQIEIVK